MPLIKNKSQQAFTQNLKAELAAGKLQKQALAIAYSVQRRSKADGGGISPYDFASAVVRNNPYANYLKYNIEGAKSLWNNAGQAGKDATESYFGALNNDYKPSEAVSMLDSGEYVDKEGKIIPEQYRPNVLPVTKSEKGKGWGGSDYEGAMPAMLDVWNTIGNPFASAKGVTLGSGPVFRAERSLANKWDDAVPEELINRLSPQQMQDTIKQKRDLADKYLSGLNLAERVEAVDRYFGTGAKEENPYLPMDLPLQNKPAPVNPFEPQKQSPRFYSALEEAIQDAKIKTGSPQQWMGTLANKPGVKPSEIEWSGIDQWMKDKGGKISKEELQDYVRKQTPEVQAIERNADDERTISGEWESDRERERAYNQAIEDAYEAAGNDFNLRNDVERELRNDLREEHPHLSEEELDDLFEKKNDEFYDRLGEAESSWVENNWTNFMENPPDREIQGTKWHDYTLPGGENYREVLLTLPKNNRRTGQNFTHSHFEDDKDFVAHMRIDDREIGGRKSLFMNEAQSDWHQAGATKGYSTPEKLQAREWAGKEEQHARKNYLAAVSDLISKMTDGAATSLSEVKDNLGIIDKKYGGYGNFSVEFENAKNALPENAALDKATAAHREAANAIGHVPDAPFKKEWPDLVLKSMIRKASEEGYPRIAWPGSPEMIAKVEGWGTLRKEGDKYFAGDRNMTSIVNRYLVDMPRIADKLAKKFGARVKSVQVGGYSPETHELYQKSPGQYVFQTKEAAGDGYKDRVGPVFDSATEALKWAHEHGKEFGDRFNVLDINPTLKKHSIEKGFPLFSQGSAPMPRSPYDREDRRRGGRVNKADGGGFGLSYPGTYKIGPNDAESFGLSLPQDNGYAPWSNNRTSNGFMGPLQKGASRNNEARAGNLATLEDVIGPDRAVYPPDSPYSKFRDAPSDAPEYSLDLVGGPKKQWLHKDDEQPPARFGTMSGSPLGEPQSFNRKFVPEDTSRFNKKRGSGADDAENIQRDSVFNPDKSNAYWAKLSPTEQARDVVKSYGAGFANGIPDVIDLPRKMLSLPGRLGASGAVPDQFINPLPKGADWKKRIDNYLYGEGGEPYQPRTSLGRFANASGEISPYIAAAAGIGATRGGMAAALPGTAIGAILGAALRSGKESMRSMAPLAVSYPVYSGYADGGSIPFGARESAKQLSRAGLVNSASAGRADKVPGAVKSGSYVMPADVVSAMGQGNTMAGARVLNSLMGGSPFGANAARPPRGRGMTSQRMKRFADGGGAQHDVPVNVSGGEFIFPPEAVAHIGGGDVDHGHAILDALALQVRQKNINHLSSLPPPRKD